MSEMEDRQYERMSHAAQTYAFHEDAENVSWVNLRWVRDVVEQFQAPGQSLREIGDEREQLAAIRRAVKAVDAARRQSAGS